MSEHPAGIVAVPALDWMWTVSAAAIFRDLQLPSGTRILHDQTKSAIDAKRNDLVNAFLTDPSNPEWICFIDSDMLPAPDTISRLLDTGKEVVSAACFRRIPPYSAAFGTIPPGLGRGPNRKASWYTPEQVQQYAASEEPIIEVDACGTGCLLIRRRILQQLDFPWFKCWETYPGSGEDIHFCDRLRILGTAKVFVDTRISVGHVGITVIDSTSALASALDNSTGTSKTDSTGALYRP